MTTTQEESPVGAITQMLEKDLEDEWTKPWNARWYILEIVEEVRTLELQQLAQAKANTVSVLNKLKQESLDIDILVVLDEAIERITNQS